MEFSCDRVGSRNIRIDYADQPDRRAFLGKLLIDTGVIASESANSDNRDLDQIIWGQGDAPRQWPRTLD